MRSFRAWSRPWLLAALLISVLTSCNRVELAYRNLDLLVPWTLDRYLDLDGPQRRLLAERLERHLDWHCSTQLPRYVDRLDALRAHLGDQPVDEGLLQQAFAELRQSLQQIGRQITPSAVELLRELDDEQVAHLRRELAERQREDTERYLQPPLERQIRERAERSTERLENWLGPLEATQRQRVLAWSYSLGEQNRRWLENRRQWQAALLQALEHRQQADFATRLAPLLQDRQALWSEADRAAFTQAEHATLALLRDIHAEASERQQRQLAERLAELRQDLAALQCTG